MLPLRVRRCGAPPAVAPVVVLRVWNAEEPEPEPPRGLGCEAEVLPPVWRRRDVLWERRWDATRDRPYPLLIMSLVLVLEADGRVGDRCVSPPRPIARRLPVCLRPRPLPPPPPPPL